MMQKLIYTLLLIPYFVIGQKLKPVFAFSLNNGLEKIDASYNGPDVSKKNSFGYYLSIGFNLSRDSTFLFYSGIRYGLENSRFMLNADNKEYEFRTKNLPLTCMFAPGIRINHRQSVFITLGICRVLQANSGGGGGGSKHGKEYTYSYTTNLPRNVWEFRPGIKYQIKPLIKKKLAFEFGVEPSLTTRTLAIEIENVNHMLPSENFNIHYDLIVFYFGVQL